MKKKLGLVIMISALLYGMCMLDKNGVDMFPTAGEFVSYLDEQTAEAAEMYHTVREWVEETILLS